MTVRGNEAWQALSDECEALPDDGFEQLLPDVQRAVARGEVDLSEVVPFEPDPGDHIGIEADDFSDLITADWKPSNR